MDYSSQTRPTYNFLFYLKSKCLEKSICKTWWLLNHDMIMPVLLIINRTTISELCHQILKENVRTFVCKQNLKRKCHAAGQQTSAVILLKNSYRIKQWNVLKWPNQSLDLNSIEMCEQFRLHRRVWKQRFTYIRH